MSKLYHLKLLPAALGWLFFSVALAFIAVMYIPSARAAEPASVSTPNANSLTWVHHKIFGRCGTAGTAPAPAARC